MTETTTEARGAFGEVLAELMRSRGIEPTPENIRALGERSGLDADVLLANARGDRSDDLLGGLSGLDRELALTELEKGEIAFAYAYEEHIPPDLLRRLAEWEGGPQ